MPLACEDGRQYEAQQVLLDSFSPQLLRCHEQKQSLLLHPCRSFWQHGAEERTPPSASPPLEGGFLSTSVATLGFLVEIAPSLPSLPHSLHPSLPPSLSPSLPPGLPAGLLTNLQLQQEGHDTGAQHRRRRTSFVLPATRQLNLQLFQQLPLLWHHLDLLWHQLLL